MNWKLGSGVNWQGSQKKKRVRGLAYHYTNFSFHRSLHLLSNSASHFQRTGLNGFPVKRYSSAAQLEVVSGTPPWNFCWELINDQGHLFTALCLRHSSVGLVDKVQNEPCRANYTVRHTGTRRGISFLTAAQQWCWGLSNLSKPSAYLYPGANLGLGRLGTCLGR